MLDKEKTAYIPCMCRHAVMELTYWPDDDIKPKKREIYINIYERPDHGNLWWRIKAAWKVLVTGIPDALEIAVSPEDAAKIVKTLNEFSSDK